MIYFGKYLKDYLEYNNISQTEFATRIGITQKHMNEIINGKTRITLEMAGNIERLTGIKSEFIINVENSRILKENILKQYGNIDNLKKEITIKYHIDEIKKRNWIKFKDETDILQVCIDLLDFLKVKDFYIIPKLEKQILFKKTGNDFNKIALWIAHCDETIKQQNVNEYNSYNLMLLIKDLQELAYNQRGFAPFELAEMKKDVFGLVKGIVPSKVMTLKSNYALFDYRLSGIEPKISNNLNVEARFIELFYQATEKLVNEKKLA